MADSNSKIFVVLQAFDKMSSVINQATFNAQSKLQGLQKKANDLADKSFKSGQQLVAGGLALGAPIAQAVKDAMAFENGMVGIQRQVKGLDESKPLNAFKNEIFQLARTIPLSTTEIQDLIIAGARMDIPKEKLVGYTREVAKMAIAFDMAAGEVGDKMAMFSKLFDIPIENIGNLADTINYLDDKTLAKGPEIIDVLGRIAGTAKSLGAENATALASTMLTLGETSERAGTALNTMIVSLTNAQMKGAKFQQGLTNIGMTGQEVAKGMASAETAQSTLYNVLEKISKLDTTKQSETLVRLFGTDAGPKLLKITQNFKEYRGELALLQEQGLKGSGQAEFNRQNATAAANMTKFKNIVTEVSVKLGTALLPSLISVATKVGNFAMKISEFVSAHPKFTKILLLSVAALSALALTAGYVAFAVGGVSKTFALASGAGGKLLQFIRWLNYELGFKILQLKGSIFWQKLTVFWTDALATSTKVLNWVLKASPWILLATVAIGAVMLIVKYWGPISKWFKDIFEKVKVVFFTVVKFIANLWLSYTPAGLIFKHWDKIVAFFSGLFDKVKKIFFAHVAFVLGLGKTFFNAGKNIVNSIWEGIKAFANRPVEAIKNIAQKIRNFLPFSPAREGALKDIHKIKLIETIAATIKPGPMVNAMQNVSKQVANVSGPSLSGNRSSGSVINFSPTINLSGGATKSDADNVVQVLRKEFEKLMKDYNFSKQRVAF